MKVVEVVKKPKLVYFTQCDRLRTRYQRGEEAWQAMMQGKRRISDAALKRACDLSGLLDDGETLEDFVAADPDYGGYQSTLLGTPCLFIQHSGFEFIFVAPGDLNRLKADLDAGPV